VLVIPRLSEDGSLLGLNALPFVPDAAVLRLGVISVTGTGTLSKMRSVMADAGLLDFFDAALFLYSCVEGISGSSLSRRASVRACRRSIASTLARMTPSAGSPHWLSFVRHIIHCTFST